MCFENWFELIWEKIIEKICKFHFQLFFCRFPAGFMDVIQIEKTGENFRLIYDVKGRYTIHRITNQEAKYKLCHVLEIKNWTKNVPYLYTSDGRTIRYPDPIVKANDSIR